MTVENLRIHEDYVTKTMFTLTERLASPGADIRNVKGRTECLFEAFYTSARKNDGTYCKIH